MCEKLKTSIKGQTRFKQLAINLAMLPVTTTYVEFSQACRRYDEAMKEEEPATSVNFTSTKYTPEQKAKWLAKKKAKGKKAAADKRDAPTATRDKSKIDCWNCGKMGHFRGECTKKIKKRGAADEGNDKSKQQKQNSHSSKKKKGSKNGNWPKGSVLVDDDEKNDDSDDGDESNMIGGDDSDDGDDSDGGDVEYEAGVQINSITTTTNNASQRIYVDSCASRGLCIVKDAGVLDRVTKYQNTIINTTKKGATMTTQGEGCIGTWADITICEDSQKNIISVDRLKAAGYGLVQLRDDHVVDLDTLEELIKCAHNKGMPYVMIHDLFALVDKSGGQY